MNEAVNELVVSVESADKFFARVIYLHDKEGLNYIEAITTYAEDNNVEMESLIPIIKSNLKLVSLLRQAAEDLNYFTKTAKLSI